MSTCKVFVGTDRSQLLAVKVLEHSIKKHSTVPVEVIPMCDLPVPTPKDPTNYQRTGFSFSRFCIPKFMNYEGRAIYMDADMMVFSDIKELFEWPMGQHKIVIQEPLKNAESSTKLKYGAPKKRIRQCAVMLLDCSKLDWSVDDIVSGLDEKKYNYSQLMHELCILKEEDIGELLPFEWNSLETYSDQTRLLHFTDMRTQPWVSPLNKNGYLWFREVNEMLKDGTLTWSEVKNEIRLGYFRPSLVADLLLNEVLPHSAAARMPFSIIDTVMRYKPHRAVYDRNKVIRQALRAEAKQA